MPGVSWKRAWSGRKSDGLVHQRAREVVRPTGGIVRGKFPSRKTGRMVHYEGLLELDAIYLFETSPLVESYGEQPSTILYPDGGRLRRYTPDFILKLRGGCQVLIEIKPSRSLLQAEIRHKFEQISAFFARQGTVFLILTEQEIRLEPRLANLKWLYHQAPPTIANPTKNRMAVWQLAALFPMTAHQATSACSPLGTDPYSLLMAGYLTCDLSQAVIYDTQLELNLESEHVWFCIAQRLGF